MAKLIFIILIGFVSLYAKTITAACIPVGKVIILKKSIMSLDLSKKQKSKLVAYEERLKEKIDALRNSANYKKGKLSNLFDEKKFLKKKFADITREESATVTKIITEYFENMYKTLTKEQKAKLIKRFKRTERKRRKR
jgi:Spy/CpxP family protein refolding chaperone